ncbi:MAG: hypothetical protein RLZ98_492 [Pseudomonadota bacterium]|jgi:hypothetical protein
MPIGTPNFEIYARNIKRIYWAEFIDSQLRTARANQFKASLVEEPYKDQVFLAANYETARTRESK